VSTRLTLALTLTLTGCDVIAGRALGPDDRCPMHYQQVVSLNTAGDTVAVATVGTCAPLIENP
jgi:hypothetical protein